MNALTWVRQALGTTTSGPVEGEEVIVLDERHTALTHVFVDLFGAAIEDALGAGTSVYEALTAVGNVHYQPFFDQWKAQGRIA